MNTPITGRIYHVVDKTTGEVVKIGSTLKSLAKRFNKSDYQRTHRNHFLREIKQIGSSDLDWYEKGNPYCPFLWHLFASEHMEMVKMGTYRNSQLSNWVSPLMQKFYGFDSSVGSSKAGKKNIETGHLEKIRNRRTPESKRKQGLWLGENYGSIGGKIASANAIKNKTGLFARSPEQISKDAALGGRVGGKIVGPIWGRKAAESGHCARIAHLGGQKNVESGYAFEAGHRQGIQNISSGHLERMRNLPQTKTAVKEVCHKRWHVKRDKPNPRCVLCSEQSLVIAYA